MTWLRDLVSKNLGLKLVSLFLAFLLWMVVFQGDQRVEQTFEVPVRIIPASNAVLMDQDVRALKLRVEGTPTVLRQVSPVDVVARIPVGEDREGTIALEVQPEHLGLPRELRVLSISPRSLTVTVERKERRRLPIRAVIIGEPAPGFRVDEEKVRVQPRTVVVEGARSEIAALEEVPTEPVDVTGATEGFRRQVALAETGKRTVILAEEVVVKVRVRIVVDPSAGKSVALPGGA
jgi:YbbR domain-containing protein